MSDSATSSRIVPDVDQSLTGRHLRPRRGPSLWPIWLMICLLLVAVAGAGAVAWYERERLLQEMNRLSGEVSNMHARLDSGDADIEDTLSFLQAQVVTLFQEQEQLAQTISSTRQELYGFLTDNDERVSTESLDTLDQQVERLRENAQVRDSQLAAIHVSLDALERAGIEGRQSLMEEVTHLEQLLESRSQLIEEEMAALQESLTRRQTALEEDMTQRLDELDQALAEMDTGLDEELEQRIDALESEVRQVRQAQLAFSAQLEMLR
ncbi:hypothetical protein GPM19_08280 [Halomonas sp. ZH2S]|uniref:Chromosome partition protein Smc n=1 Tax=Vreelandella zhuhanensis TaxID=2684210 RepID=A0A7X3H0C8_9GAMM|nr:hypothetical protein [Halomonas zhuhanensis]MWJ28202.1 hypothetical protein [Halomonas zhuhanensis]